MFSYIGCAIFVANHLGEPQPLLIQAGTNQFALPLTGAGFVRIWHDETIELFCTTGFANPPNAGNTIFTSCINETRMNFNGAEILFQNFRCNALPDHVARLTARTCHSGQIAEIGFQIGTRFFLLAEVCHNAQLASNTWVHYYQRPGNQGFQRSFIRDGFMQGNFFPGMNIDNLYFVPNQRRTIGRLLGSDDLSWIMIEPPGSDIFLARGHLAARADFIFWAHQHASFYFINAAPQWQSFNGGNWEHIEDGVRRMVSDRNIDTEIWTGTYGVITLPDINGNRVEIFLEDENSRLPVPRIFYKVVIRPSTSSGIVFIGVNNPHASLSEIQNEYIYCNDVAHLVNYIPWNRHNITGGYSYACAVNEFANFVGHLPQLPTVTNLLV